MRRGVYSCVWEVLGMLVVAWAFAWESIVLLVAAWAYVKVELSRVCRTGLDGPLGFGRAFGFFARGPI